MHFLGIWTWWNIQARENSASILERDQTLRSLKKYDTVNPWGWSSTSENGCFEIEDWGFSVQFVLGLQENSVYTWHFNYDITKWCKVYTETDSWFQRSHEEFGKLQTSSGKFKKLKFKGLLLSKKYIPSAKTSYTENLYNITFNYLCENSPNSFCHSRNHKSFLIIQFLCIFLAQALYTFYKTSPSKCNFSDLPLLALKFTKFLMPFFKQ